MFCENVCKVATKCHADKQSIVRRPGRPGRVKTESDGTRAETRFGLSAKRTSPFVSAGVSVHLAAGSRGVRISGSNAG